MIHIKRSTDKKYYVTVVGDNGEVLSTSETLNSKKAAHVNINALIVVAFHSFENGKILVQDDTIKPKKKRK